MDAAGHFARAVQVRDDVAVRINTWVILLIIRPPIVWCTEGHWGTA